MPIKNVLGAIRRTGTHTWSVIEDAHHRPTGIGAVEDLGDRLRVNFDFEGDAVLGGSASPDETLAAAGIVTGPSIALACATIKLGRSGILIRPEQISNPLANIWIDIKMWCDEPLESEG